MAQLAVHGDVERGQGRGAHALVVQLAVGIVLNNRQRVARGQLHQAHAPLRRERRAGGILEAGDDIEEARPDAAGEQPLQGAHIEAVLVHWERKVVGPTGLPGLERTEIGGLLYGNWSAGVDQQAPEQVEALLRAGGDEQLLGGHWQIKAAQPACHKLAQRGVALGGAVLQAGERRLGEGLLTGGADLLGGEELWGGEATSEGDHLGLSRELEQVADGRATDAARALGDPVVPDWVHRAIPHLCVQSAQYS